MKKINLQIASTLCKVPSCQFRGTCANHVSAGMFREEDGFSPELVKNNEGVYCKTIDQPILVGPSCETLPVNYDHLGRGYVVSPIYISQTLTVEEAIEKLSKVKNKKMCLCVCIDNIPYQGVVGILDETTNEDGVCLLMLRKDSEANKI